MPIRDEEEAILAFAMETIVSELLGDNPWCMSGLSPAPTRSMARDSSWWWDGNEEGPLSVLERVRTGRGE
jgi:hypothetical protein